MLASQRYYFDTSPRRSRLAAALIHDCRGRRRLFDAVSHERHRRETNERAVADSCRYRHSAYSSQASIPVERRADTPIVGAGLSPRVILQAGVSGDDAPGAILAWSARPAQVNDAAVIRRRALRSISLKQVAHSILIATVSRDRLASI